MFCSMKFKLTALNKDKNKNKLNNDESYLLYKIVSGYSKNKNILYELLTGEKHSDPYMFLEAQPKTQRKNEKNTHLDLAMGSLKNRGTSASGIEYDASKNINHFLFCETKWDSDISITVKNFPSRNQLQRVIDNALYFTNELKESNSKIFVILLTPKQYKDEYESEKGSRLYGYKYDEYKDNPNQILKELDYINTYLPLNNNLENRLKDNLKYLTLRWITLEEIIKKIPVQKIKDETINFYNSRVKNKI